MSAQESFAERRKYKRVELRVPIEYKVKSIMPNFIETKKPAEKRAAETANISLGGIQIIDDIAPACGQIVSLAFRPGGLERDIRAFARVRWADFDDRIKKYRIGLEFYYLHDDDSKMISGIVN
jgi:c-di-GMP-binding flagellar brake protein YcgR